MLLSIAWDNMPNKTKIKPLLLAILSLSGCILGSRAGQTPPAILTPTEETGWQILSPGLELRTYPVPRNPLGQLQVLRIDPALYRFRVHYYPGAPLTLNAWQAALPGAAAFVNANFFSPDHTINGMLVADLVVYGQSYRGQGGRFVVRGGEARILSNIYEPYGGEPLEQAVEAFPMLVYNGQQAYVASSRERPSRRTVIALDGRGRVLLIATPLLGLSLESLSVFLAGGDLGIVDALNLDGGGSTMMFANSPGSALRLTSMDPVPSVLAVYPR